MQIKFKEKRARTELIWLRIRSNPYEHGTELSDSIKSLQFLNKLRDYQFLNSESCSLGLFRSKIKPSVIRNTP